MLEGWYKTERIIVDSNNPQEEKLLIASKYLQAGQVVAFPTETVYGVGAIFNDVKAVEKIFRAKNRPASNPLLVHISRFEHAELAAAKITALAVKLMENFWPGPLSLILPARSDVPGIVTGGKSSVGLRMPSHPVALRLMDKTGPLAATSANLSGRPSPVSANHVLQDLDGLVAAVLDAGPTGIGMESTILDFTGDKIQVIRCGGLPLEDIEEVLGEPLCYESKQDLSAYKSRIKVLLAEDDDNFAFIIDDLKKQGKKIGIVHNNNPPQHNIKNVECEYVIDLRKRSTSLFAVLRDAEVKALDNLVFAPLPADKSSLNTSLLERIYRSISDK